MVIEFLILYPNYIQTEGWEIFTSDPCSYCKKCCLSRPKEQITQKITREVRDARYIGSLYIH